MIPEDILASAKLLACSFFEVKTTGYYFKIKIFCDKYQLQCVIGIYENTCDLQFPNTLKHQIYHTISVHNDLLIFGNILRHLQNSYCDTDCESDISIDSDSES